MAKGNKFKKVNAMNAMKARSKNAAFKDGDGSSRVAAIKKEMMDKAKGQDEPAGGEGEEDRENVELDENNEPVQRNSFEKAITLYTLQDKIKRQPEMYRDEFHTHMRIFQEKLAAFKESPAKKDEQLEDYCKFMAHISGVYREDVAEFLCHELINVLQQYYSILNPSVRLSFVTALKIQRGKDVVSPSVVLPVLLKLFRCEDKGLRKFLHSIIVSDLKKLNQNHKVQNINRKLQTFIFQML